MFLAPLALFADGDVMTGGSGPDDTTDLDVLDVRGTGQIEVDVMFDESDFGSVMGTITFEDGQILTFSQMEAVITDSASTDFQAFFGGSRYESSLGGLDWDTSQIVATNTFDEDGNAGKIVEIDDALENRFVSDILGADASSVWIGASDAATEGTFVNSEGLALEYTNWEDGAPNDPDGSEDYAAITSPEGTWDDIGVDGEVDAETALFIEFPFEIA